jgi:rhamnose transport system permease protein
MTDVHVPVGGVRPDARASMRGRLRRAASLRELSLVAIYVVFVVVVGLTVSRFFTASNFEEILLSVGILMIVAVAETPVVLTRNIDISVGSMVGLTAFVAGDFASSHPDLSVVVVLALGAGLGLGLGIVNGVLVAVARVPAIMATLGTLYLFRGADSLIAGSRQVTASTVPESYLGLASDKVLGVSLLIWIAIVIAIGVALWLRYTRSGRHLYAIGSNPDAAGAAGLPARRLVFAAFAFCGMLCGVAGVLWGARYATVTADAATGFELQVLAAVVVGGVNVFGGSGSIFGVLLGALLLGTIGNALSLMRLSQLWLEAIAGAALLVAVVADHLVTRRLRRPE